MIGQSDQIAGCKAIFFSNAGGWEERNGGSAIVAIRPPARKFAKLGHWRKVGGITKGYILAKVRKSADPASGVWRGKFGATGGDLRIWPSWSQKGAWERTRGESCV